jgi:hypothetical protein
MTDRLTRLTTALAVLMVAGVAAVMSYQQAYELVISHGERGFTAGLLPFTVDGLIWAASMFSGVLGLLHDVAPGRLAESFCNTSATCGAHCRRCQEACPPQTCNKCNTPGHLGGEFTVL